MSFDATRFHSHCLVFEKYFLLILYAYAALTAVVALELMRRT
jgi:hypothetical protein